VPGMLEGRVAVVTGAGRGIGASVARRLAGEGALVVVNDLGSALDGTGQDKSPALEVVDQVKSGGGEAVASADDVSDFSAAGSIVRQAIGAFGRLDVVINAAGILRDRMIFNMSEGEWDAVIRVHLREVSTCPITPRPTGVSSGTLKAITVSSPLHLWRGCMGHPGSRTMRRPSWGLWG